MIRNEKRGWGRSRARFVLLVAVVLIVWLAVGAGIPWFYATEAPAKSWFGDPFSGVNALFAGLAFLGLIVTIRQQQEELEATRDELRGQKEQLQIQNDTSNRQRFENSFFKLLEFHHGITSSIRDNNHPNRSALPGLVNSLTGLFDSELAKSTNKSHAAILELVFDQFMDEHERKLGHYFRNMYHIVEFVDQSQIEDKRLYATLLWAQLSSDELVLLFFYCLSKRGRDQFKPLAEKYRLLKTVPKSRIGQEDLWNMYAPTAFDGQQWRSR